EPPSRDRIIVKSVICHGVVAQHANVVMADDPIKQLRLSTVVQARGKQAAMFKNIGAKHDRSRSAYWISQRQRLQEKLPSRPNTGSSATKVKLGHNVPRCINAIKKSVY